LNFLPVRGFFWAETDFDLSDTTEDFSFGNISSSISRFSVASTIFFLKLAEQSLLMQVQSGVAYSD